MSNNDHIILIVNLMYHLKIISAIMATDMINIVHNRWYYE